MWRYILMIIFAVLLVGCVTPYQPMGVRGGYQVLPTAEDQYIISVGGNAYTSPQRVYDYALLKAADLALDHGRQYFSAVVDTEDTRASLVMTQGYGYNTGPQMHTQHRAHVRMRVYIHDYPDAPWVHDAALISQAVRDQYQIPARP
jgi:hypothetical protein